MRVKYGISSWSSSSCTACVSSERRALIRRSCMAGLTARQPCTSHKLWQDDRACSRHTSCLTGEYMLWPYYSMACGNTLPQHTIVYIHMACGKPLPQEVHRSGWPACVCRWPSSRRSSRSSLCAWLLHPLGSHVIRGGPYWVGGHACRAVRSGPPALPPLLRIS